MDAAPGLRHRLDVRACTALIWIFCVGCSSKPLPFAPASENAAPAPSELGPYAVGVRTVTLSDLRRTKTSSITGEITPRKLVTEIWYPADEDARGGPGRVYRAPDILTPDLIERIGDVSFISLPTTAVENAEPRREGEKFPLVIFSHGNGGVRMQSTYYTIALASHGYIVVAPDHTDDTLADFIRRGGFMPGELIASYDDRSNDVRFLIDHFTKLGGGDPLAGLVDVEQIGTSGHSFGGVISIRSAGLDRRVKAVVAQAPAGYTLAWIGVETPLPEIGVPIEIQSGARDETTPQDPHAVSLWENMAPPRWWLSLETAGHFTFSDLCVFDLRAIEGATMVGIGDVLDDGCGPNALAPEVAYPLIRHFAIALFNTHLRRSPMSAAFLDRAAAPAVGQSSTEVTFSGAAN